ncbi:MAG TPA: NAD(P)-binding domain-containing protein [Thermoanaerobaculia bacterium]|nr:NAD(P)-binding domain-containing protein [Thermoanaerobaculia bacterium]
MQKVRVGVLGSGDVGRVLASGFLSLGHDVTIGSRDPEATSAASKDRATSSRCA